MEASGFDGGTKHKLNMIFYNKFRSDREELREIATLLPVILDNFRRPHKNRVTYEEVNEWFYPDGPYLRWTRDRCCNKCKDCIAGTCDDDGYMRVSFRRKKYFVHHLVWLYFTGRLPRKGFVIDHFDGNRSNNSFENLYEVTQSQNTVKAKRRPRKNGLSKGIKPTRSGRYSVVIASKYYGTFETQGGAENKTKEVYREYERLHEIGRKEVILTQRNLRDESQNSQDDS